MKISPLTLLVVANACLVSLVADVVAVEAVAPPYGFVSINLPPHTDAFVSCPFVTTDASLQTVLAEQLVASSTLVDADRVMFFGASMHYRTAAKVLFPDAASVSQWMEIVTNESGIEAIASPAGDWFRITPGIGFVLSNRQAKEQTVRIGGQVVLDSVQHGTLEGVRLVSYPFTSGKRVQETQCGKSVSLLSATNTFQMGAGYWAASVTNTSWEETRPYGNPFSLSNAPVRIVDLIVVDDKVTLDIRVVDPSLRSLDLLVLDLFPSDVVTDFAVGWKLVASNIVTEGKTELLWSDNMSDSASSFRGVRLYLVTRAGFSTDPSSDNRLRLTDQFTRQAVMVPATVAQQPSVFLLTDASGIVSGATSTTGDLGVPTTVPVSRSFGVVFVDIKKGSDSYSGLQDTVTGNDGPKKTIGEGTKTADLTAKDAGSSTIVIRDGVYNEDLRISGKPVRVRIQGNVTLRDSGKNKNK